MRLRVDINECDRVRRMPAHKPQSHIFFERLRHCVKYISRSMYSHMGITSYAFFPRFSSPDMHAGRASKGKVTSNKTRPISRSNATRSVRMLPVQRSLHAPLRSSLIRYNIKNFELSPDLKTKT